MHDIMCVYVCVCTILRFVRKCACIHSVGAMPLGRANLYMCARTETRIWQEELLIWLRGVSRVKKGKKGNVKKVGL